VPGDVEVPDWLHLFVFILHSSSLFIGDLAMVLLAYFTQGFDFFRDSRRCMIFLCFYRAWVEGSVGVGLLELYLVIQPGGIRFASVLNSFSLSK